MLKKVIEIRNSKILTYKLVALRHEKIIKLFLKWSVLTRGMLKGGVSKWICVVQVITYKGGDCGHLQLCEKVTHILRHGGLLIP